MRILHILSQIPSQTGSGVFLSNLVRYLDQKGWEQGVVLGLPAVRAGEPMEGISPENRWEVLFETDQLPFPIPGMSDVMPYESTPFSSLDQDRMAAYIDAFQDRIFRAIGTFKPQVILSNHLWIATAIAVEGLRQIPGGGRRLFAVSHGTDLRQMMLVPEMQEFVRERCRHVTGVFSLNAHQRTRIGTLYGIPEAQITVIGNGYDSQVFHPRGRRTLFEDGRIRMVYAGKLSRSKGLEELLRCMERLGDPFRLAVAGSGSGPEAEGILRAMARTPGVAYRGQLRQPELADLFRSSDLFILPSYYEGIPLVVLEALACGCRVVVNDLPGLREWLGPALMGSGRLHLLELPPLEGVDTCAPEASEDYTERLEAKIREVAADSAATPLAGFWREMEQRSWKQVFSTLEATLRE